MTKSIIAAAVVLIATFLIVPATTFADQYFVIRDQTGHTAVTNGLPGYGWSVQSGPYYSIDAAERSTGTGTGNQWVGRNRGPTLSFPRVVPKYRGQFPVVESTP